MAIKINVSGKKIEAYDFTCRSIVNHRNDTQSTKLSFKSNAKGGYEKEKLLETIENMLFKADKPKGT